MPLYDYACTRCGRTIEVMHGVHGHGPATCEVCGGPMRKVLSPPAIVFKGSGWAKKDARSASHTKAAASSAASGEGGSEAAPTPKTSGAGAPAGGSTGGTGSD